MATRKNLTALTMILAIAGMAACNGDGNNPPPQTPADQTTTTAATPDPSQSGPATTPQSAYQTSTPFSPAAATPGTTTGMPADNSGAVAPGNPSTSMNGAGGTSNVATPADGTRGAETVSLNDAQIVSVIQAADEGEIAQAREVSRKAKSARVKRFAQHMITDHSAAETKLSSLDSKAGISPQTNAIAEQLKSNGDQIMADLKSASGAQFDTTYMDAQVKEHTKVLDLLDNRLIPHAQNPDLVKTLQDIRTKVAAHLKDAQDIQASLQAK
jgi:putative membrane protein